MIRLGGRHFLLVLIAPTEALQERWCLGILHRLTLCSGILYGRDLYSCILLPPGLFSGILHRPDLCPRVLHVTDLSVHLHGPDLSSGILHNLCWDILNGLYGSDLCPLILLCRPRLELLEQVIGCRLTRFGVTLIGRFKSGSNFVACWRVRFRWLYSRTTTAPYLINPASLGSVRLISGMQMMSKSPPNSASMYGR